MRAEHVMHAEHVILSLLLGELQGGTGLEHGTEVGELRHGLELLRILCESVLLRRHRLTVENGGGETVGLVHGLRLGRLLGHG